MQRNLYKIHNILFLKFISNGFAQFRHLLLNFFEFFLQALANLAYEMNAKRIALICSSRSTVHTLLEEATALGNFSHLALDHF